MGALEWLSGLSPRGPFSTSMIVGKIRVSCSTHWNSINMICSFPTTHVCFPQKTIDKPRSMITISMSFEPKKHEMMIWDDKSMCQKKTRNGFVTNIRKRVINPLTWQVITSWQRTSTSNIPIYKSWRTPQGLKKEHRSTVNSFSFLASQDGAGLDQKIYRFLWLSGGFLPRRYENL